MGFCCVVSFLCVLFRICDFSNCVGYLRVGTFAFMLAFWNMASSAMCFLAALCCTALRELFPIALLSLLWVRLCELICGDCSNLPKHCFVISILPWLIHSGCRHCRYLSKLHWHSVEDRRLAFVWLLGLQGVRSFCFLSFKSCVVANPPLA